MSIAQTGGGAGFLMEQGTGKTLTAIAVAGRAFLDGQIQRVLVISPASVVPVWPKEFAEYAAFPFDCRPLLGDTKKRSALLSEWPADTTRLQVAVVNYEATWRDPLLSTIKAWKPDMIICDESQRIKTHDAQQSKTIHELGKLAKYRLILSGTPINNNPLDIYSQYKFADPSIFGSSYYAFRNRYAVMGGYEGKQIIAYKNLDELKAKIHSISFRVTKADALDLPDTVDQVLYCQLEPKARSAYDKLVKDSVAKLSNERTISATNVLSQLLRLSQLTGGYVGDDTGRLSQASKAKMQTLDETLDDLLSAGKKVVIFARFTPEIQAITELANKKETNPAMIDGSVSMAVRGEEVKRFQTDPNCRVFVAQIQSAGLGITLTAADTAIFYSLDFSYANYEQARARIHRLGQRNTCTYIHLLAQDTVDEKIMAALKAKKSVADNIVDNWRKMF